MSLTKSLKLSPLWIAAGLAAVMLVSAVSLLRADDGRQNPYEFLSQFEGRQFPNEIPPESDEVIRQQLGLPLGASAEEVERATRAWEKEFNYRRERSGPNPIAYAERMADLERAQRQNKSVKEVGGGEIGTAKMLMIPIEFPGTDELTACDAETGEPAGTVTVTGPVHGTIENPAGGMDNRTIWAENMDTQWYQDLMFGDGPGIVRADMNDGEGVDLSGVSAARWYEEQSEGLYTIEGEVYPAWIQLDHSVAYYGWDADEPVNGLIPCDEEGDPGTPSGYGFEFAIDAVNKLNEIDPDFDWSEYDVDGNGVVDHLMFIHAGEDDSAGGGDYPGYQLWAHSWDVYCDYGEGLSIGCVVDDGGTPDDPSDDILIANYTHIPENPGIGVVVHEYGHDIGLPDFYDLTGYENSTSHWDVMSGGSWNGVLGGTHPAPFTPYARYFFGWVTPHEVDYTVENEQVMLGQSDPTPQDTQDSVWINLPDQEEIEENLAGEGKGLHAILGNFAQRTLTRDFDLSGATAPVLTFDTYFDIELDWDYAYVRASTDGGATWDVLLNEEGEYATQDPNDSTAWLGQGGLTGTYEGTLTYDLSAYAGEASVMLQFLYNTDAAFQAPGIWIDNIAINDGETSVYSNDLEDVSDWTNDGWEEVPYAVFYEHRYMLEWRNDEGSIASVGHDWQYQYVDANAGWADTFEHNTPGMLVWYYNEKYQANSLGGHFFDPPSAGSKARLLLVDSHFDPITWSGGFWDPDAGAPAPQLSTRKSASDGAFGLDTTPPWMLHDYSSPDGDVLDFGSRPPVSRFDDSQGWYPGFVYPGSGNSIYYADQDASVVIPAQGIYTTMVRGLDGNNIGGPATDLYGASVSGLPLGSGNPGDGPDPANPSSVAYGVTVDVIDQSPDGSVGTVVINAGGATAVTVDAFSGSMDSAFNGALLLVGAVFAFGLSVVAVRRRRAS